MSLNRWFARWRPRVRPLFHWKYSGFFIAVFLGAGVTLATTNHFTLACWAFSLFGVWTLLFWLTGDWLGKQRQLLRTRNTRRNAETYNKVLRKYLGVAWGVSILIFGLTSACLYWTHGLEQDFIDKTLQGELQDTYDRLTIQPQPLGAEDDVSSAQFTVTNNAHFDLDRHTVSCLIKKLVTRNYVIFDRGRSVSPSSYSMGLLGSGDGETVRCMSIIQLGPIACGDVAVIIDFALVKQPTRHMRKAFHFSTVPNASGGLSWVPQSVVSDTDYCEYVRIPNEASRAPASK